MKSRLFLTVCVAVLSFAGTVASGAKDYPDWDGYPPFYSMNGVTVFQGKVYGTTSGGIFRYDPGTREYETFYKNHGSSGLSSSDVQCASETSRYLYLGFVTAGLMRFDSGTDTFQQITFPEYIPNDIEVCSIHAANDTILYVGHSEGLDILNLVTKSVRTCNRLGSSAEQMKVNAVTVFNGKIWACTGDGLAVADVDASDLDLPGSWTKYTYSSGFTCILPADDGKIYLGTGARGVVRFDDSTGTFVSTGLAGRAITDMTVALGSVWAAADTGLCRLYDGTWSVESKVYTDISAIRGTGDTLWVATSGNGLRCYTDSGYVDVPTVPGPARATFTRLELSDDGAVWAMFTNGGYAGSLFRLRNDSWDVFFKETSPKEQRRSSAAIRCDNSGNLWVSYWGSLDIADHPGGMDVLEDVVHASVNSSMVHIDSPHDIFKGTEADYYVICPDITRDSKGNMWIANYQTEGVTANSGVVVVDGYPITKYRRFSPAGGELTTGGVVCVCADDDGWFWAGMQQAGIMARYYGDDPFDSTATLVGKDLNSELKSPKIKTIKQDKKNGCVWVGTDAGLNRITKNSDMTLSVGDSTNLLAGASTEVLSIEVDRFYNKWVGTTGGLVQITSANELGTVYTTANSGLFSNKIYSLKYDDKNDVLWIGTDSGLNCFHVLGGSDGTDRIIRVYPNPFSIWGTDSECTFDNLLSGSKLRVFTFRGDLVRELTVTGTSSAGTYYVTWNGRNFKNEPVASGIYFFTGTDKNNQSFRDKMAVIRR